eukprot:5667685-Pyramimonas_sp.AAC.1
MAFANKKNRRWTPLPNPSPSHAFRWRRDGEVNRCNVPPHVVLRGSLGLRLELASPREVPGAA